MNSDLSKITTIKKNPRHGLNQSRKITQERIIQISRVIKVTKGGKKLSVRVLVVVGDGKGKVGVGIAKGDDIHSALKKAKNDGIKNLIKLPITKSLSIPHLVYGQFKACKVLLRPSIEGSGVVAGGAIRSVIEITGIKNIIAKQLGSSNLMNNARATIIAFNNLTTPFEIAKKRGIPLENCFFKK
jgi:small subunit ribosomal protein S5